MNAEAQAVAKPAEPSGARLVMTLGVAGLVAGLALVGVYTVTKPRIDANKQKALESAIKKVVPGSTKFAQLVWDGNTLTSDPSGKGGKSKSIYGAYDDSGAFKGYAIPGAAPGYADVIEILYGYDPIKKVVIGLAVLESKETPGIGDKIFKDAAFATNFEALAVAPPVKAVPHGSKKSPNQIDAISGATVSSKAVGKAIRKSAESWLPRLFEPGKEPAAPQDKPGAAAGKAESEKGGAK
jgi:electron transport complex protein RnfG